MLAGQIPAPPGPPGNLNFTVSGGTVTLTWGAPTIGGALSTYIVEAGSSAGGSDIIVFATNSTATSLTATAPPGVYFVRIRGGNAAGTGAPSNETQIIVGGSAPCLPPPSPANAVGSVAGSLVTLQWSASPGATSYVIEAGSLTGSNNIAAFDTQSTATSFSAAAPPGTYFLRIRARSGCGTSGPSSEVVITVGGSPPNPNIPPGLPNIQVLQNTAGLVENTSGNAVVVGEVQNVGGGVATFVRAHAILRGSSGAVLADEETFLEGRSRRLSQTRAVTSTTLAGGETGCFQIVTGVRRNQVISVDLSATHSIFPTEPPSSRVELVGSLITGQTSLGLLRWSGELRNVGSTTTRFNQMILDVKDASGRVLDCDFAFVRGSNVVYSDDGSTTNTGLYPGQTGPFDGTTFARAAQVASLTQWITWSADERAAPLSAERRPIPSETIALYDKYEFLTRRFDSLLTSQETDRGAVPDAEFKRTWNLLQSTIEQMEQLLAINR